FPLFALHLSLPSFPTRRSSDLKTVGGRPSPRYIISSTRSIRSAEPPLRVPISSKGGASGARGVLATQRASWSRKREDVSLCRRHRNTCKRRRRSSKRDIGAETLGLPWAAPWFIYTLSAIAS